MMLIIEKRETKQLKDGDQNRKMNLIPKERDQKLPPDEPLDEIAVVVLLFYSYV